MLLFTVCCGMKNNGLFNLDKACVVVMLALNTSFIFPSTKTGKQTT
jgi:hypothetical protein